MKQHGIEWLNQPGYRGESWNPMTGCTRLSGGCRRCWAEAWHTKKRNANWVKMRRPKQYDKPFNQIQCFPNRLSEPLSWRKPRAVAVCLMGDLFHEDVRDDFIAKVFCVMIMSPLHTFHILTKRAERMRDFCNAAPWCGQQFRAGDGDRVLVDATITRRVVPNLRLGVSIENQKAADARLPHLRNCPAACRFVSYEPALDAIDVMPWVQDLSWLIVGHESGKGARPGKLEHVESIVEQCRSAVVPVYVKQIRVNGRLLKSKQGAPWPDAWPMALRKRKFPQQIRCSHG